MRKLAILGSTGSIGTNTLDVIRHLGGRDKFEITAITGNGNIALLAEQAIISGARMAVTADESRYDDLKSALSGTGIAVSLRSQCHDGGGCLRWADWVMAAIVGTAGLAPTLAAAQTGADIALANKECLVSAGDLFVEAVKEPAAASSCRSTANTMPFFRFWKSISATPLSALS